MGGFQKTTCNSGAPQFPTVKVQYVLHLGVIQLNPGLHSSYDQQTEVIIVRLRKIHCSPYKFKKKKRPVKKWTIWGTFGPKFPFFN